MTGEISISYAGKELDVQYQFKRGKGFIDRDEPPDEDEVNVLSAKLPDGNELPLDDIGTRWDIEMMILEKVKD